jgi:MFS family permease
MRVRRGHGAEPPIPEQARLLLGGFALSAVGDGLVLPFLAVHLRVARDFPVWLAGAAMALVFAACLVTTPIAGVLLDRFAKNRVLAAALLVQAAAAVMIAVAPGRIVVLLGCVALGVGNAPVWPALHALLAVAAGDAAPRVFARENIVLNAGMALGALSAGLLAAPVHAATFRAVLLGDAVTFLGFAIAAVRIAPRSVDASAARTSGDPRSYRTVFADRALRWLCTITALTLISGAQLNSGYGLYAVEVLGLPVAVVSVGFAANTITVVALQTHAERWGRGRRRTTLLAISGCWSVLAWSLAASGGLAPGLVLPAAALVLFPVVLAVGELFFSPVEPAMLNSLASNDLRGRYNAASMLSYQIGWMTGPLLAGLLLGTGLARAWLGFVLLCSVGVVVAARRLARCVDDEVQGVVTTLTVPTPRKPEEEPTAAMPSG